ncbi:MAG: DUF177 domain-containing protein [Gammaproteobacteria bacterium]
MANQFPEQFDPIKFAKTGENLSGQISVAQLHRLTLSLYDDNGIVKFDLKFEQKNRSRVAIGKFETEVNMICQRCLNPVKVPIQDNIQLEFVIGEDVEGHLEDQGYEVVTLVEEMLALAELIEDEVMLALPFSPLHDEGKCSDNAIIEKLQKTEKPNPFAVLAKLKNDQEL